MGQKKRTSDKVKGSTNPTSSNIGIAKHRISGHTVNSAHFTGPTKGKRIRRKGKSRKEKEMKRGTHVNKYDSKK